jgi:hypothetical protein
VVVTSPADFAAAVEDYAFEDVRLELAAVAPGELTLVGEGHGRRETPSVLYTLAEALGTRALGLEWSHEELDGLVQAFLRGGPFDVEALWELPPTAEVFSGDGRFTAGHVALLHRLRDEGRLEQAILFDRVDPDPEPPDWRPRDRDMAQRLLAEWHGAPLLAAAGAFHADTDTEGTMAWHLAREHPELRTVMLRHDGEPMPRATVVLPLPPATPAIVPGRG